MEKSLGKTLRDAREASGLTVDDAVYRAKLPRAVVEALESGDFGFFNSPLYARSFLRQYGDYIGADVSPWIDDLIPVTMIDSVSVGEFIDLSELETSPALREKAIPQASGGGAMAAAWLILITGGLIWAGLTYYQDLEHKLSEAPAPTDKKPTQAISDTPSQEAPEEKPIATNEPEPPRRAIIVDMPGE